MHNLPGKLIDQIDPFAACFCGVMTWMKAQLLLAGVVLTPGRRLVSEALQMLA